MRVNGDGYDILNEAIQAASFTWTPRSSKSDIVEYYKETYTGRGGKGQDPTWRQHLQRDLSAETGVKYNSIRRQFDPSRIGNAPRKGSKNAKGFEELGKKLPMKKEPKDTAGKKARVEFKGEVCIPSGKGKRGQVKMDCRDREFSAALSASQASEMKHGSFDAIFDAWGLNPDIISSIEPTDITVDFL